MLHTDFNRARWNDMLEKYGTGVSLKFHTREAKFVLGSEIPDATVDDLMGGFNLETIDHYFTRAKAYRDRAVERIVCDATGSLNR